MYGFDSYIVDGNVDFATLQRLMKDFRADNIEEKILLKLIQLSQNYLKVEYE